MQNMIYSTYATYVTYATYITYANDLEKPLIILAIRNHHSTLKSTSFVENTFDIPKLF